MAEEKIKTEQKPKTEVKASEETKQPIKEAPKDNGKTEVASDADADLKTQLKAANAKIELLETEGKDKISELEKKMDALESSGKARMQPEESPEEKKEKEIQAGADEIMHAVGRGNAENIASP